MSAAGDAGGGPVELIWLDTAASTNSYAKENFPSLPDNCLVATANQTAGRGRRGRAWISPPGQCLCATWVVKAAPGRRLDMVPAALALAALDSLRAHAPGVDSWLKWPNDILVGRRKLAGMLCELVSDSGNRPAGMLAGLGVNLNMDAAGLAAVAQPATSLAAEGAEPPRPENFAARLGESIAGKYAAMLSAPGDGLFRRWRDENRLLGQEVEVVTPRGARMSGVFEDLGPDGQMVLRLPGGAAMTLHCGEVSIAKPWPPDRPPTK